MAVGKKYADATEEIVDRLRRVETRLTRFMEANGFDTEAARPVLHRGAITIPNISVSLKDTLETIPKDNTDNVALYLDGYIIAWIRRA